MNKAYDKRGLAVKTHPSKRTGKPDLVRLEHEPYRTTLSVRADRRRLPSPLNSKDDHVPDASVHQVSVDAYQSEGDRRGRLERHAVLLRYAGRGKTQRGFEGQQTEL